MRQSDNIKELQRVIRELHYADSTHIKSVPIMESFDGQTVWDGTVEVFQLHSIPRLLVPMRGLTIRMIPLLRSGM